MTGDVFETWHPVTREFGMINAPLEVVTAAIVSWWGKISGPEDVSVSRPSGTLADVFSTLAPLTIAKNRILLLPTTGPWTAVFANGINGSDPGPIMSAMSRELTVRAMRLCIAARKATYPAVIWEVYDAAGTEHQISNIRRSIAAANDGGRWVFETSGEPFPFEHLSRYEARLKRDRFDEDLLRTYLAKFGIHDWADALLTPSDPVDAVQITRPPWPGAKEYSLQEVIDGLPWRR